MLEAVKVEYLYDWTIKVWFNDGAVKIIDLQNMLEYPAFQNWHNKQFFSMVRVQWGTTIWPDDTDLAPEYIYENGEDGS